MSDLASNYILRALYLNRILRADGKEFQKLFEDLMVMVTPDFQRIKPQGRLGDGGNDGYINSKGDYYQVYAPESVNKDTLKTGASKFETDFSTLQENWDQIDSIQIYNFVINDKQKGLYAEYEEKKKLLSESHPNVTFTFIKADELLAIFDGLPIDKKATLTGAYQYTEDVSKVVEFNIIDETINFLLSKPIGESRPAQYDRKEFIEKIEYNGLSSRVRNLLEAASYQIHYLEEYFDKKEVDVIAIKERLEGQYEALKNDHIEPDLIFNILIANNVPSMKNTYQRCIIVILSYFFEACDIFESESNNA